jgi:NhaP-type Na+/H+ or K+/H+ antiporter
VIIYAVLSLTVVRMAPVALALVGTRLSRRDVLFLGWVGPRGLASVIFGMIALENLRRESDTNLLVSVVVVTVLLSVIVHGVTGRPLAARFTPESSAG